VQDTGLYAIMADLLSINPNDPNPDEAQPGYLMPNKKSADIHPVDQPDKADRDAAAAVIRRKLASIYSNEPDASEELAEAEVPQPHSKHQEFMHELSSSGKSLAEIQTEWHHYYVTLPDDEKHQVWQEFYASNAAASQYHKQVPKPTVQPQAASFSESGVVVSNHIQDQIQPKMLAVHPAKPKKVPKTKVGRSTATIKKTIVKHATANGKLKAKHHVQSLIFGLSMGFVVILVFLFGFFNEFFLAPFIQPSRHASATPLILSNDGVAPTATPEVIIPKINVEIPVNFDETSTNESTIENDLESGVVHYPTTVLPGQNGNTAFFGHSSNNIFNKGKYKFAFVQLHTLVPGDTFYITNAGKVFVYKVITKDIVSPSNVSVLGAVSGQTATATLITCDPPGTSLNRLIIVGQQISPDVASNTPNPEATTGSTSVVGPASLPGNGPTLWTRFWRSVF
jgi:LPXTG-site transpeptidase (sortase) family protein